MIRNILIFTIILITATISYPKTMQVSIAHDPYTYEFKYYPPLSRPIKILHVEATAYTAKDKGMRGDGLTSSGSRATEGRTIAASRGIPFGTRVYILKLKQTYIVEDRGGAISKNHIDIYFERYEDAIKFGRQKLEVIIID